MSIRKYAVLAYNEIVPGTRCAERRQCVAYCSATSARFVLGGEYRREKAGLLFYSLENQVTYGESR